jgi:flagellar hook-basal body complex protein FliE
MAEITGSYGPGSGIKAPQKTLDTPTLEKPSGKGFGDFLAESAKNSLETLQHGEQKIINAIENPEDDLSVVTTVNELQMTVEEFKTVWDKGLEAYKNMINMGM